MAFTPLAPPPAAAEVVLPAVQKANWSVLVSRGGAALALALARLGKPLLVVEADPEQVEELQRHLADEPTGSITVCCELLGAETGETCWYRYNDPRRNGRTGPEALQPHAPNLQLLSLELRPQRRLEAVLSAWEERRKGMGEAPLEGPGVLVGIGLEALPVLHGSGPSIERFQAVHWASFWLGAEAQPQAWEELLQRCSLWETDRAIPNQEAPGWSVLKQHREGLLERKLHEALAHIANLASERDSLTKERNALKTECDSLKDKHQELSSQRDSLRAERDDLATQLRKLSAQRDHLEKERDSLIEQTDKLSSSNHELRLKAASQEEKLKAIDFELCQIITLFNQHLPINSEAEMLPPSSHPDQF